MILSCLKKELGNSEKERSREEELQNTHITPPKSLTDP